MLDKRLQLGGLQVGGPRTMQNSARFRVANNVYQTRDDYMIPRFHGNEFLPPADFASVDKLAGVTRYDNTLLTFADDAGDLILFDENGDAIPQPGGIPSNYSGGNAPAQGMQFIEKFGNLYFHIPNEGLFKYDGVQAYRAGTPLPYYQIAATYLTTPTFYVRALQHHIDQQANVVHSGYFEFQARVVAGKFTVRTDQGATPSADDIRAPLELASLANNFLAHFVGIVSSVENFGAGTVVVTTNGDHNVVVGERLINRYDQVSFGGTLTYGTSYEVTAFDATTVSLANPKYLSESGEWVDGTGIVAFANAPFDMSNYYISLWTSSTETGNYALQGIVPCMYESAQNHTYDVFLFDPLDPDLPGNLGGANLFNLAPNLGDIYDVTTVKTLFKKEGALIPKCFSTYGDLAIISYDNEIYFSDPSLGGSFEMVNGLSFIVVGEGDDGVVQAVCGNVDFMVVSRQFKNYYLAGTLPTSNYRVQEISETSLGVYSNECMISVVDKIFLFNKQGHWAVYAGGRCEEVSFNIRGFFDNFSNTTTFDEEAYFDIDSFPTYAQDASAGDYWIKLRLDVNRNLLFFITHGDGQGQILVLNLNNGEYYTWNGMLENYPFTGTPDLKDMAVINGEYYVTVNYTSGKAIYKENKAIPRAPYDYMGGDYNPRLKTTWFTAREPSLEKKTKQVKMWGIIDGDVTVRHAIDWSTSASTEDGVYTPTANDFFSHKKRMEASNALACSVDLEFEGDRLELEGLEIEFEPFQMGMKR